MPFTLLDPSRVFSMKDVFLHTRDTAWEVKMVINGQTLYGGTFMPKDSTPEEVERARLLAVDTCRKLELRCKKKRARGQIHFCSVHVYAQVPR